MSIPVWTFAIAGAHAQCAPSQAAVQAGGTVNCTGTQNGGYVLPATATDVTINVQQGATVTGSQQTGGTAPNFQNSTILLRDGSTINNDGTITVTAPVARDNYAVNFFGSDLTLNNNGAISLVAPTGSTTRIYGVFTSVPGSLPAGTEFEELRIVNNGSISVTMNGNGIARGIYGGEDIGEFTIINNGTMSSPP